MVGLIGFLLLDQVPELPPCHQLTTGLPPRSLPFPIYPLQTGFLALLGQDGRIGGVSQLWCWKGTERGYWTMGGEARRRGDRLAAGRSLWRNRMRKGYLSVVPFTPILQGHRKNWHLGSSSAGAEMLREYLRFS